MPRPRTHDRVDAFIMRSLGAEVIVVERGPALLPQLDVDVREAVRDRLQEVGIRVLLHAMMTVEHVPPRPVDDEDADDETPADRDRPESVVVRISPRPRWARGSATSDWDIGGNAIGDEAPAPFSIKCDAVLSAAGRLGNTFGMNLEGAGCRVDHR